MADFPALPLWTDAYLADTRHLTTVQHGAYLLLLMEAWRRPSSALPDDDVLLAKLAGMTMPEWQDTKPSVMAFWKCDGRTKTWTQKRLLKEKNRVKKSTQKQQSNAKSRWNKEKDASHGNARGDAKAMPNASQNDASRSRSRSISTATPLPPTQNPVPSGAGLSFDLVEAALRSVPGLENHPVAVAPSIAPLWAMVQQGWNLETEILPGIRTVLAKARPGAVRHWAYFVPSIEDQRRAVPSGRAVPEAPDEWPERLSWARANKCWFDKGWGPPPRSVGCRVPPQLLTETDGVGWSSYAGAA